MKKFLIMCLFFLFMLVGCSDNNEEVLLDGKKFKKEYEELNGAASYGENVYQPLELDGDNSIVYKGFLDIVEMMREKKSFVVYFGFSSCPWCRSVVPTLLEVAKDLRLEEFYYVDIHGGRDVLKLGDNGEFITETEASAEYNMLLQRLDAVLEEYTLMDANGNEVSTGRKRIYAPNIISIVDGKPVKMTDGVSELQTDAYMELTEEMLSQSYEEIKEVVKIVSDREKVCSDDKKC